MNKYKISREETGIQNLLTCFLYRTKVGSRILAWLIKPEVSRMVGRFMDMPLSRFIVPVFIRVKKISMGDYRKKKYKSYNDFFTRKIKMGKRKFPTEKGVLGAPCDSRLSVYRIDRDLKFKVKNTVYNLKSITGSQKIAEYYQGGYIMIFRLCVDDYHRYAYVDNGTVGKKYKIPGVFHTVNPIAGEKYRIYKENTREYSILDSDNFGEILMMEVGAMMVGRIVNYHTDKKVRRGMEKGKFEFGGSTVILMFREGMVRPDKEILSNTSANLETIVKMGEAIGVSPGHREE